MQEIYGVNPEKPFTAKDVRNAIIKCFKIAHEKELNFLTEISTELNEKELEKLKDLNIKTMIKEIFKKNNSDFENPTKQDLIKCINDLAEFSKSFRDQKIIEKHYNQIMQLINKL